MISVTKLLTDSDYYGDSLRYTPDSNSRTHGTSGDKGPVVVWNSTRSCNLGCVHCYAGAVKNRNPGELSTTEAEKFINDLAGFRVPVLLISGGEPLVRDDLFHIIEYARLKDIRVTISTNGTLITKEKAKIIKDLGVSYVGISLDGLEEKNDIFRREKGAFVSALNGIRNCLESGQKVGLRFTICRQNLGELEGIFDLIEKEAIPRACFYHLVYSGRGSSMQGEDVSHEESRRAVDLIIEKTLHLNSNSKRVEILTVDNHCDGIYIYNWSKKNAPERSVKIKKLLENNGGNRSGIAIGSVDWEGFVHPDQFSSDLTLGSIRERPFSNIWTDPGNEILDGLRDRKKLLKGRCGKCSWLDMCNGNFRARASVTGDYWAPDPSCYLTDVEIGARGEF